MANDYFKFKDSLSIAQKYEQWYSEIFLGIEKQELNDNNEYDVKDKHGRTYEVKTEITAAATHNICIETESRNKQSGINTTKADFYVFILPILNRVVKCL